ncbi:MAG TPA: urease accessory protein UreF [Magnetospirillaceae bacterium]|jgi:urease accessory protein
MVVMDTPTEPTLNSGALVRLLAWLSPAFPVGGYTYSHGVERAVEEGTITDGETLRPWIEAALIYGPARVDADLLRDTWRAVMAGDEVAFERAIALGATMRGTPELALESLQQGESFLTTVSATWPNETLAHWTALLRATSRAPAYPVAIGLAAAAHGVPLEATLSAYLHAFAAALVSAAVRLVPLGQTVGQKTLAALEATIAEAAAASLVRTPDQFGSAAPLIDLLSIAHETQHVRLFRS